MPAFVRRLVTIPAIVTAWAVWLVATPLWLPIAFVVDQVRGDIRVAVRAGCFLAFYLSLETLGLATALGLWVARVLGVTSDEAWIDSHHRLEAWWGSRLLWATQKIFGLRLEVTGAEVLGQGPYLLLVRHSSIADTLLASDLVGRRHGIRLRYVLKRELLWDPCLDVVGNRLPNAFIDRGSDDSKREIARVADLARGLGPRDGLLIYPEGTRFSTAKRERILHRLAELGHTEQLAHARALEVMLPPRVGGTLAALEAAPQADVVLCGHAGLEGVAGIGDLWRGALLGQCVRVDFRRVPRAVIPDTHEDRQAWLYEAWHGLHEWVAARVDVEEPTA